MPIDWNKLKTDWKKAANDPKKENNTDEVIEALLDALKEQIDNADLVGVDSGGDTLTNITIQ